MSKIFKFDREKDQVVATRDFDHGVIHGKKGEALQRAEVAALSDTAIKHLVEIAKVATIKNGAAEAEEETDAADATKDAGGKAAGANKGAAKP